MIGNDNNHDKDEDEMIHDKDEDEMIHDKDEDEMIHDKDEDEMMIPFFSIASRDFDHDLTILKKVLHQFEQRTHSEKAYMWGRCCVIAV